MASMMDDLRLATTATLVDIGASAPLAAAAAAASTGGSSASGGSSGGGRATVLLLPPDMMHAAKIGAGDVVLVRLGLYLCVCWGVLERFCLDAAVSAID
jgi:hypothetical protein